MAIKSGWDCLCSLIAKGHADKKTDDVPRQEGRASSMRPLLLTTLGRTGSTYALGLLGCHPDIVVYKPFKAEARYISYWMEFCIRLKDHKSWTSPVASDKRQDPSWLLGSAFEKHMERALYPEVREWFKRDYAESLENFAKESLARHYRVVAEIQNKIFPLYFSEKALPNHFTSQVLSWQPDAKEIVLVRDFRDMFCSITAFNKKRGFEGFARNMFGNDEEYIRKSLAPSARMLLDAWQERKNSAVLMRYEDLVIAPEATLNSVLKQLRLDNSDATIKDMLDQSAKLNKNSRKHHQTSPGPAQSIGRYKNDLESRERRMCTEAFEASLQGFGYLADG